MGPTFFSYAREDDEIALPLATSLRNHGLDIWLDQWNIAPGEDWDRAIDRALFDCNAFIVVVSSSSVDSDEVRAELRVALDERKTILSIITDDCRVPRYLRLKQYIDATTRPLDHTAITASVAQAIGPQDTDGGPNDSPFVSLYGLPEDAIADLMHILSRYDVFMEWLAAQAETPEKAAETKERVSAYGNILAGSQVFPRPLYQDMLQDIAHLVFIVEEVFMKELKDAVTGTEELLDTVDRAIAAIGRVEQQLSPSAT